MPHCITALILREPCDEHAAREWDVAAVPLRGGLRLVHIDHYYTAYWQARRGETGTLDVPSDFPGVFPRERVVASLVTDLAGTARDALPPFALVMTDYFGGLGEQWARAYLRGEAVPSVRDINAALRVLGVEAAAGLDEFDTVGLADHRHPPDHLDRYPDLCDELGV